MRFYVIIAFISLFLIAPDKCVASEIQEDSILLPRVILTDKSVEFKILREVLPKIDRKSTTYLTMDLKDSNSETYVKIVAHTKKKLTNFDGYTGYCFLDSIPVIFYNRSKLRMSVISKDKRYFQMLSPDAPPGPYDPDEFFFRIKGKRIERYESIFEWWMDREGIPPAPKRKINKQ